MIYQKGSIKVSAMKILIMSCSSEKAWYRDKIGKLFNVCSYDDNNFMVRDKGYARKLILKKDCEVIEK